ncbi:hypothetical protein [Rhizobium azibense]|uniref:Uncharacterized protein n=1 Tax=Rhizobium azibense TaxID=1136135 RepID=A0A4R3RI40_9HYPH|nr:hypothetical protein [Rhizobium azibense]TCU34039.1 hypothetical protein EV129_11322 [Rhizobium azibense]
MREESDCEEFLDFCRRYGDETASGILEDICCRVTTREWPWRIRNFRSESRDREGNNATLTGFVEYRAKCWWFKIDDGNWNGTEVREWDPSTLMPGGPVPEQSVWLFASIEALMVRFIVNGSIAALRQIAQEMNWEKEIV